MSTSQIKTSSSNIAPVDIIKGFSNKLINLKYQRVNNEITVLKQLIARLKNDMYVKVLTTDEALTKLKDAETNAS